MRKIVRMVFGAHMYGLDTPQSDMDYKGIYLPELNEILLGTAKRNIDRSTGDNLSKNTADDVDDTWFSLAEFLKLARKGETVALDMLHVNPDLVKVEVDMVNGWIWKSLVFNREKFYTKNLKAYMGYVKKQAAKYGLKGSRIAAMREAITFLELAKDAQTTNGHEVKLEDVWNQLPENEFAKKVINSNQQAGRMDKFYVVNQKMYQSTNTVEYVRERVQKALDSYGARALLAEKNEGVDWKAVSHALRAGYQLRGILAEGSFSYPLAETEYLARVKAGTCDYKTEVSDVLEALIEEIEELVKVSDLPDVLDNEFWDEWLIETYMSGLIRPACRQR